MTRIADRGLSSFGWVALAALGALLASGCSENTVPQITQLEAEPNCDVITSHDDGDYLEVRFFARASGGNVKSDPTGANSPLDWTWDFGDGAGASNVVNPVHRYTQAGEYDIVVTVTDDDGDSDTKTLRLIVGASFSDLDVLTVTTETLGDSRITFARVDSTNSFVGWEADFDGRILTPCPISGLFQNYLWHWEFGDSTSLEHVGNPTHVFPPTAEAYEIELTVTENNTLVARSDTTSADYPAGVRLSNTARILLPGTSLTLRMDGLLTVGLDQIDVVFTWPEELEIAASAVATADVTSEGFTMTADSSVPGVLTLRFQGAAGMSRTDEIIPFADITFSRPLGQLRVPVGTLSVELESISVNSADGSFRASSGIGGDLEIDNDCNENLVADRFEVDCNGNGYEDSCDLALGLEQDCNGNGIPDTCDIDPEKGGSSQDCNRNGIPDECDISSGFSQDCDNDGIPDDCQPDCNFNDISDACDIRDGTSLDCNGNGEPDECENDCNNNGIPDECDIRDGVSQDCDDDGIPNECEEDCNLNGVPDDCDIRFGTSFDCNGNGIPDECEEDCNANGVPDLCDILFGGAADLNGNGIPDECE